ncbi:RICIN domain-containing protein [Streptomyces graminilatus]|uniref:RICIN domain-containing protein n=1 Tax=Streptomyces graminilatus TaxID=1464070 RepID=UPI000A9C94F2|nr:ACP synthase [Streptomyces graminilatus]
MNAGTASAYVGPNLLRNWETGRCLDSNSSGQVYTNPCQTGNDYQTWNMLFSRHDAYDIVEVQNKATGLCLRYDINRRMITANCLGSGGAHAGLWAAVGSSWDKVQLKSAFGGNECVDNTSGGVSLRGCYNTGLQLWKLGF